MSHRDFEGRKSEFVTVYTGPIQVDGLVRLIGLQATVYVPGKDAAGNEKNACHMTHVFLTPEVARELAMELLRRVEGITVDDMLRRAADGE